MSRGLAHRLVLFALLALLLSPVRAQALVIGVGDQTPAMFSDPRFQALGVHYARLDVPWNVVEETGELERVRVWLTAARTDHVLALITFDHSWASGWHHTLPSVQRFGEQFADFHSLFPWVSPKFLV
jgi:hypothetical protein